MSPRLLHYSDLEGVYDDPDRLARLASSIDHLRDDETLVVGSGDNTAPGVLSLVSEGRQALPFFDRVGPDAETLGNHDFDYGLDATRHLVRESPQQWVSANVRTDDGDVFGEECGVAPSTVLEVDGARVGLVGVTDPATKEMSPRANGLRFTDPVEAVGREIGRLRNEGVDHLVVLSHLGAADDDLARTYDLDAVLGGHVHEPRAEVVANTVCTRTGPNGHRLVEVDLADGSVSLHDVTDAAPDEALYAEFSDLRAETGLTDVVGHVERPVERRRDLRTAGECRIGNFVADAYRWAADADLALHNSGGLRDGPALEEAVTAADLVGVVPFDEPVSVAEVDGEDLYDLFADAYRAPHGEWRWDAHISGATVAFDTEANEVRELHVGGDPVDPDRTYELATNDYLLSTAHEFPTLTAAHRDRTLTVQYEVLVAYAREHGIQPELEDRIDLGRKASEPSARNHNR
ncbi:bifunctional metallophosphatase/5'-nucleotidase [Halomarina salina]|uniref:Bifunctional metallophosphatase/5'-nucleotidase n=1 Tax=Halomarina salina TaxID=1872699 RepID=A0ABD5RQR3_9EURY|nr:bifunctional metallophosphatase/5'-nucleotidase [Halomarina salina]